MRIGGVIGIVLLSLAVFLWVREKDRDVSRVAQWQLNESQQKLAFLQSENARLSNLLSISTINSTTNESFIELVKLRGEVGLLRRELESLRNAQTVVDATGGVAGTNPSLKLAQAEVILKTLEAESTGDTGRVIQLKMDLADMRLKEAETAWSQGRISKEQFAAIKREIWEMNQVLRLQKLKVAKANQDWSAFDAIGSAARAEARLAELNLTNGHSDEYEVAQKKTFLEVIETAMRQLNAEAGRASSK